MCIIIDANTFSSVFDSKSDDHMEFVPVLNWILNGKGKVVYGGTQYRDELRVAKRYLGIFGELKKARKVVELPTETVDAEQQRIENLVVHHDFDDPHLIAIISVSGCRLVCSKDTRAYPFIKNRDLYARPSLRPKIYSGARNSRLLRDSNIAQCCKDSPT